MKYLILALLLAAGLCVAAEPSAPGPATRPVPLPTPADLAQMHDAGDYRLCLQQIARVLMLRGDAARPYDPFALLLLRGDCLLHLQDRATASEAYAAAARSTDPAQRAEARATALLINKSVGLVFTPKPPAKPTPISIVERADRKKAMLALHQQMAADAKPLLDAALESRTLVPVIDGTPTFIDIRSLEIATGSEQQIRPTLVKIGEHARELMNNELGDIDGRVSRIEKVAGQVVDVGGYGGYWWNGLTRRGLTSDDREALRGAGAYADRIGAAASHFHEVSRSLGGTGEKWNPIIEQSARVGSHARQVLALE